MSLSEGDGVWPQEARSARLCPPCGGVGGRHRWHPPSCPPPHPLWSSVPLGGGVPGLRGPPALSLQEPVAKFSLKEIQSTRTQRPTAGSSYPYVEITLGDLLAQGITQLQLEQVGDTRGDVGGSGAGRGVPRWWRSR